MDTTTATFPTCGSCRHDWHGLDCAVPVVTVARHGRRTDPCGCRPARADTDPQAHAAA